MPSALNPIYFSNLDKERNRSEQMVKYMCQKELLEGGRGTVNTLQTENVLGDQKTKQATP